MATNPPASVKVTIGQNNPAKVTMGQSNPTVTSLSYGTRTLKSAADLNISNAQDGYAIIYKAATDSFIIGPATGLVIAIDNGTY